jgi:hypothetical protein
MARFHKWYEKIGAFFRNPAFRAALLSATLLLLITPPIDYCQRECSKQEGCHPKTRVLSLVMNQKKDAGDFINGEVRCIKENGRLWPSRSYFRNSLGMMGKAHTWYIDELVEEQADSSFELWNIKIGLGLNNTKLSDPDIRKFKVEPPEDTTLTCDAVNKSESGKEGNPRHRLELKRFARYNLNSGGSNEPHDHIGAPRNSQTLNASAAHGLQP